MSEINYSKAYPYFFFKKDPRICLVLNSEKSITQYNFSSSVKIFVRWMLLPGLKNDRSQLFYLY